MTLRVFGLKKKGKEGRPEHEPGGLSPYDERAARGQAAMPSAASSSEGDPAGSTAVEPLPAPPSVPVLAARRTKVLKVGRAEPKASKGTARKAPTKGKAKPAKPARRKKR